MSIPWFTQESVDKEQGIIGQEIRMVEDDPDNQVFYGLMECLFDHHPIRVPIAGTQESISHITADTLYACHKAFYDPANMVLCVAGPVEAEKICDIAREILPKEAGPIAGRDYGPQEPEQVAQPLIEETMEVSIPIFQLGYKGDAPQRGEAGARQELLGELGLRGSAGQLHPLYARLYREGLINRNFSYGYEAMPGATFLAAGGESKDPEAVRQAVQQEAERIVREGVDPDLWRRIKKGSYGGKVRSLNSFENLCVGQAQSFFAGSDLLDFPRLFDTIEKADVENLIARWVTPERTALSVVRPGEEEAK